MNGPIWVSASAQVAVLREVDFLFCDRPDHALSVAVLPWFADCRHADLAPRGLQGLDVLGTAY